MNNSQLFTNMETKTTDDFMNHDTMLTFWIYISAYRLRAIRNINKHLLLYCRKKFAQRFLPCGFLH